jgi:SAM-dependent methyltransferase
MEFLIILVIVIILYLIWKYWTLPIGAGYDPAPMDKVHKMLDLARVDKDDVVYDLGSGDGRIVITAARRYGAKAVGIEVDPFRFLFSCFLVYLSGQRKKVKLRFGNFFKKRIDTATVVTLFLFQPTNNRLKEKLINELKPGARIVSYIWTFEGWKSQRYLPEEKIYLYIVNEENQIS